MHTIQAVILIIKIVKLENMVRNFSLTLVKIINYNSTILKNWQTSLNLGTSDNEYFYNFGFSVSQPQHCMYYWQNFCYTWYVSLFGLS